MHPFVWDEWPNFFRGRLRVLYGLTGEVVTAEAARPAPTRPRFSRSHCFGSCESFASSARTNSISDLTSGSGSGRRSR